KLIGAHSIEKNGDGVGARNNAAAHAQNDDAPGVQRPGQLRFMMVRDVIVVVMMVVIISIAMMMVMVSPSPVNMIGLYSLTAEPQEESHAGHNQTQRQTKTHLNVRHILLRNKQRDDDRKQDDHTGMGHSGNQAKDQSMPDGAVLTDQIGGHQSFTVARRQGM